MTSASSEPKGFAFRAADDELKKEGRVAQRAPRSKGKGVSPTITGPRGSSFTITSRKRKGRTMQDLERLQPKCTAWVDAKKGVVHCVATKGHLGKHTGFDFSTKQWLEWNDEDLDKGHNGPTKPLKGTYKLKEVLP